MKEFFKKIILILFFFSTVICDYSCKSRLDVNDVITNPNEVENISVISLRFGIANDTTYFTNSQEEINSFLQLFKVYEQTSESKSVVMNIDHVDGTIFINTKKEANSLKIDFDGDCCYWFYYQKDTVKNLFTKKLSEFLGHHSIEKHGYDAKFKRN